MSAVHEQSVEGNISLSAQCFKDFGFLVPRVGLDSLDCGTCTMETMSAERSALGRNDRVSVTPDAKLFVLRFTVLLLVLPITTLFLVRDIVAPAFELKRNLGEGLAIASSVIVVQLILVWSCLEGFKPERDEREIGQVKKGT